MKLKKRGLKQYAVFLEMIFKEIGDSVAGFFKISAK